MPEHNKTVKVRPIPGEPYRYYVESWQRPHLPHVVDLLEHHGNGACDCRDFLVRCTHNLKVHAHPVPYGVPGSPNSNRTQCRHIYAARESFLNRLLRIIAAEQREPAHRP